MATAIDLVREFLQIDRLVIYKIETPKTQESSVVGSVVYGACSQDTIPASPPRDPRR